MINKKTSRLVFLLLLAGALLSVVFIRDIRFTYDYERFFSDQDPELAFFKDFRKKFGNDTDFLLVGLENNAGIFDSTFLAKTGRLTTALAQTPHVERVTSLTNATYPLFTPLGPVQVAWLHANTPEKYAADSAAIFRDPLLPGSLVAENGKALALFIKTVPQQGQAAKDSLTNTLYTLLNEQDFDAYHIAGRTVAESYLVQQLEREVLLLFAITAVLLTCFLVIAFRSWWGVIVPLVVVGLAVVGTMGIIGAIGQEVDVLIVLLPTIIFIVGMSDVVHLLTRYIEELRNGAAKKQAIGNTIREVGLATLLTSVTTAVGFGSLLISPTVPIRDFGLYAAIGVLLAFVVAITLLPAVLLHLPPPRLATRNLNRFLWQERLNAAFRLSLRHKATVLVVYSILIIASLVGIARIHPDTYLMEELSDRNPFKQSFLFIENSFGGVRPFEMALAAKGGHRIFDREVLTEVEKIETFLQDSFDIRHVVSPVVVAKILNKALHGGDATYYRLPDTEKDWQKLERKLRLVEKLHKGPVIVADEGKTGRISAKTGDIGSREAERRRELLLEYVTHHIAADLLEVQITGTAFLLDTHTRSLSVDMIKGLALAFLVIAVLMGLLYRSFRIVFIALIPNMVPLLLIGAFIGYTHIPFSMSASIIFSIAFGIAVDDTIHFMSRLRLELNKGRSLLYALRRTYLSTGKAIIITSFILSAGFLTMVISVFNGTFYIGLLVSLTLVTALIADLTLLPVLVVLFYRKRKEKR